MKNRIVRAIALAAVAFGLLAAGTAPLGQPGINKTVTLK
jgi:hypothetical protein